MVESKQPPRSGLSLRDMAAHSDVVVRAQAAGNPALDPEQLIALAKDDSVEVREAVAGNPSTPATVLESLSRELAVRIKAAVAGNRSTPTSVLSKLADARTARVRAAVAANRATPPEHLVSLSSDINLDVRRAAIDNSTAVRFDQLNAESSERNKTPVPDWGGGQASQHFDDHSDRPSGTPSEAGIELPDEAYDDRLQNLAIAEALSTKQEPLRGLSHSKHEDVRTAVAANPSTSPDTLSQLSFDRSAVVRDAIAKNPRTPPEVLDHMSKRGTLQIRAAIAENSQTWSTTLERLARSKNSGVKVAARTALAARDQTNQSEDPSHDRQSVESDYQPIVRQLYT